MELMKDRRMAHAYCAYANVAGQFEVLRIDCELRQIGVLDPVVEQVYYAPEVGRIILRLNERRGYRERLLEYTRAAPP